MLQAINIVVIVADAVAAAPIGFILLFVPLAVQIAGSPLHNSCRLAELIFSSVLLIFSDQRRQPTAAVAAMVGFDEVVSEHLCIPLVACASLIMDSFD